jgi:hypothetical protein
VLTPEEQQLLARGKARGITNEHLIMLVVIARATSASLPRMVELVVEARRDILNLPAATPELTVAPVENPPVVSDPPKA